MSSGTSSGPVTAGGFLPWPRHRPLSRGAGALGWSALNYVDDATSRMVANVLSIELVVIVLTQKLAMPLGNSSARDQVALALLIHYFVMGLLAWRGALKVAPLRLLLFCLFCGVAFLFQTRVTSTSFSMTALLLLLAILSSYLFIVPIKQRDYLVIVKNFILLACFAGCLTWFDWATQILHLGKTNLNAVIPTLFQYKEYNYMNKMWGGLLHIKPNGTFFLEMSHLSQFIGMGLVFECVFFRRMRYAVFLAVSLIASFGGTGLTLVLLCTPFMLPRLPFATVIAGIVALPIVLLVAFQIGYLDAAANRTKEFGEKHGSANIRFVMPAMAVVEAVQGPLDDLVMGKGAGSMKKGTNHLENSFAWAPYSKVIVEYGIVAAVLWFLLVFIAMFRRGIPLAASMALFVQYHLLNGALSVPLHTVYAFILVTAPWIVDLDDPQDSAAPATGSLGKATT